MAIYLKSTVCSSFSEHTVFPDIRILHLIFTYLWTNKNNKHSGADHRHPGWERVKPQDILINIDLYRRNAGIPDDIADCTTQPGNQEVIEHRDRC
jgi:hypothetical protein